MDRFRLLCLLLLLLAGLGVARASGRVLDFACELLVNPDASVNVREVITYQHDPLETASGIYRFLPTDFPLAGGLRRRVRYTDFQAGGDTFTPAMRTYQKAHGVVVEMGNDSAPMPGGVHVFTLMYRVEQILDHLPQSTELFWHVTGMAWSVPIDHVSAVVTLPPNTPREQVKGVAFLTRGDRNEALPNMTVDADGRAYFTADALSAHDGCNLLISFPAGLVAAPTPSQARAQTFWDNTTFFLGLAAVLLLLGYYLVMWTLVGRDPERGIIHPRWTPPDGISPAMMRYIRQERADPKTLAITLVSLAVQGKLTITEQEDRYLLHRLDAEENDLADPAARVPRDSALSREEDVILHTLLGQVRHPDFAFKYENAHTIAAAGRTLHKTLAEHCDEHFFSLNSRYLAIGMVFALLMLQVMAYLEVPAAYSDEQFRLMAGVLILGVGAPLLPDVLHNSWHDIFAFHVGRIGNAALIARYLLYLALYLLLCVVLMWNGSSELWLMLGLMTALHYGFAHLLKAPTLQGRTVLDEIEGFRLYLSGEHQGLFAALHPPPYTAELFARYLPYALALDVEREWANQCAHVFSAVGDAAMSWYNGPAWEHHNPLHLAISLHEEMAPSMTPITVPVDGEYDGAYG